MKIKTAYDSKGEFIPRSVRIRKNNRVEFIVDFLVVAILVALGFIIAYALTGAY